MLLLNINFLVFLITFLLFTSYTLSSDWMSAGCHKVGHTRKVRIPGCVEFDISTNACRGFCSSFSTPSPEWVLRSNSNHFIWSIGLCCNIMETQDLEVDVMCLGGMRRLVFKSAKTCSCYHCKKH